MTGEHPTPNIDAPGRSHPAGDLRSSGPVPGTQHPTPNGWDVFRLEWDWPKQTLFRKPEIGQAGDCWRCCIAAILQLPAEEVPHFLQVALDEQTHDMDPRTQRWLNERGFVLVEASFIRLPCGGTGGLRDRPLVPVIACGPTQRSKAMGQHHAVVMVGDKVVFDPHPDDNGLLAIVDTYLVLPLRAEVRSGNPPTDGGG